MKFYTVESENVCLVMKVVIYKFFFRLILVAGIFVGIVKGQEARQKWVTRKKMKYEAKRAVQKRVGDHSLVMLDDFEMSAFHS